MHNPFPPLAAAAAAAAAAVSSTISYRPLYPPSPTAVGKIRFTIVPGCPSPNQGAIWYDTCPQHSTRTLQGAFRNHSRLGIHKRITEQIAIEVSSVLSFSQERKKIHAGLVIYIQND